MAYILYKPVYEKDANGFNKRIKGYHLRYYYSSMGNNAMFEHPVEIHDRKTLKSLFMNQILKFQHSNLLKKLKIVNGNFIHIYIMKL